MALFRRDWHLDAGLFSKCFKKSMRSKIKEKIKEDLRLADAIELEFEELDDDMKEVRLLEYARMMKLSKVERRIYFTNRLVFETELQPVGIAKKVAGWILISFTASGPPSTSASSESAREPAPPTRGSSASSLQAYRISSSTSRSRSSS